MSAIAVENHVEEIVENEKIVEHEEMKELETLKAEAAEVKAEVAEVKKEEVAEVKKEEEAVAEVSEASTQRKSSLKNTTVSTSYRSRFKVVFLGDMEVGKTSFISRFVLDSFNNVYQATVGIDFLSKSLQLDDRVVRLQLWDTAGQEKFRSIIPSYVRDSSIVFIIFDLANRASFKNVDEWYSKVQAESHEDAIVMLVGNKSDLVDQRQVTTEEGEAKAKELGLIYGEASAKTGNNVRNLFRKAAMALPASEENPDLQAKVVHIKLDASTTEAKDGSKSCFC
jgi:Ras-related protein Rab-6A